MIVGSKGSTNQRRNSHKNIVKVFKATCNQLMICQNKNYTLKIFNRCTLKFTLELFQFFVIKLVKTLDRFKIRDYTRFHL